MHVVFCNYVVRRGGHVHRPQRKVRDNKLCKLAYCSASMLKGITSAIQLYRRSGLVISREQGLRYDAGFAVPVLMS